MKPNYHRKRRKRMPLPWRMHGMKLYMREHEQGYRAFAEDISSVFNKLPERSKKKAAKIQRLSEEISTSIRQIMLEI